MNRDKSIDKPMKPRRPGRQRPRNNGDGGGGGGPNTPVVFGICRFLLGVTLSCLVLFIFFYFILGL